MSKNSKRIRDKIVAFRVTEAEDVLIETKANALGLTKQSYLTNNMLKDSYEITPNIRMLAGLRKEISALTTELKIYSVTDKNYSKELVETAEMLAKICTKIAGV